VVVVLGSGELVLLTSLARCRCADKKGSFMVETTEWEKDQPAASDGKVN